jgi:hypothetical protein
VSVERTVYLLCNYDDEIEVESTSSQKGLVELVRQEKIDAKRHRFILEITPPDIKGRSRVFKDTFFIKVKGDKTLQVPCVGYYDKNMPPQAK